MRKDKLLQLSMDGPTVNWKVLELFDKKLDPKIYLKQILVAVASILYIVL